MIAIAVSLSAQSQYFRAGSNGGFFIGYQAGRLNNDLGNVEIYTSQVNETASKADQFGNMRNYTGLHIGVRTSQNGSSRGGESKFSHYAGSMEVSWSNKRNATDAVYDYAKIENGDSTIITVDEKIKVRHNALHLGFMGNSLSGRWSYGMSMDIGILTTLRKRTGEGETGNWEPWFFSFKISGGGIRPKTPVAGITPFLQYNLGRINIRLYRQIMLLDGSLLNASLFDRRFNLGSTGILLTAQF